MSAAAYSGRDARGIKNAAKAELAAAIKAVVDSVNAEAKGDRAKLNTSGLALNAETRSPVHLEPIKVLTLQNTLIRGQVMAKAKKGRGTKNVVMEYALGNTIDSSTVWHACPSSGATCIISGLESGTRVWVRATAVGARNQMLPTEPVNTIVL